MSERGHKSGGDHGKSSKQIKVTLRHTHDGKPEMQVKGTPSQVGRFFDSRTDRKRTTTSSSSGASRPRDPHKSHGHEHGTSSVIRRNPETKSKSSQQTCSRIPIPTISQVIGRPNTTRAVHGSSSDTKRSIKLPTTQIVHVSQILQQQVIGRLNTTRAVHGSSSDTKRSIKLPTTEIVHVSQILQQGYPRYF